MEFPSAYFNRIKCYKLKSKQYVYDSSESEIKNSMKNMQKLGIIGKDDFV